MVGDRLRARGVFRALGRALWLLAAGWRLSLPIAVVVQAPWLLVARIVDLGLGELGPRPAGAEAIVLTILVLDLLLVVPLFTAVMTTTTLRWARGMTATPGDALAGARRHLGRTAGAVAILAAAAAPVVLGVFALPGLPPATRWPLALGWAGFLTARFAYAPSLVARERLTAVGALRASWRSTRGANAGPPAIVLAVSLVVAASLARLAAPVAPILAAEVVRAVGLSLIHATAVVWLTVLYLERLDRSSGRALGSVEEPG